MEQSEEATIKVSLTAGKALASLNVEKGSHVQKHAAEESRGECLTSDTSCKLLQRMKTSHKRQKSRRVKTRQPGLYLAYKLRNV